MTKELEGDLRGVVIWGADMREARIRDVDLTGARISHAWVVDVEIDALVDRLVVNGVDVTDYVNERDPWHPLRSMIRASNPADMQATWAALDGEWRTTIEDAERLPDAAVHESVNGEWSFVQTLQHLVFAMDKWFTAPVLGGDFEPMGLTNTGSKDFPFPGIDHDAAPSLDEVLAVRAQRRDTFADFLAALDAGELDRRIVVLENGEVSLLDCIHTVFEEELWHLRYARRDLEILGG